jgi:hypothetical protein
VNHRLTTRKPILVEKELQYYIASRYVTFRRPLDESMPILLDGTTFFTNGKAAERAGVTRQTLWRWRSDGHIPLGRQYRGRSVLFSEDELTEIAQYAHRIGPFQVDRSIQPSLFGNRTKR